jgi:thiamine pyrophosphate-dependent acetolactate synthase large subunit-like protein
LPAWHGLSLWQFYPEGKNARVVQIDIRGEQLGRRIGIELGVVGDVKATVPRLLRLVESNRDDSHLLRARRHYTKSGEELDLLASGTAAKVSFIRSKSSRRSATELPQTQFSPAMSVCPPFGRHAISP